MDDAARMMVPDTIKVPGGEINYKEFETWFRKKCMWTPCPGTMVGLVMYLEEINKEPTALANTGLTLPKSKRKKRTSPEIPSTRDLSKEVENL